MLPWTAFQGDLREREKSPREQAECRPGLLGEFGLSRRAWLRAKDTGRPIVDLNLDWVMVHGSEGTQSMYVCAYVCVCLHVCSYVYTIHGTRISASHTFGHWL